jgi:hypothetical protein
MLIEEFGLGMLSDEYGIVGDIVVSSFLSPPWACSILTYVISCLFQPFTDGFPRADIHELLSPDLLHQLIKGTFKDHLVTWVNNYIKASYATQDANRILDDIDRR